MINIKIGDRYGRLTVVKYFGKDKRNNHVYECKCDCGTICNVTSSHLHRGEKRSCGCLRKETSKDTVKQAHEALIKHGDSNTRLYQTWKSMIKRCYDKNHVSYNLYAGRGITVCDEWQDYLVFKTWALENGYEDNLQIDRIDNDKNYCPDNCRWATCKQNNRNKRNNRVVTIDGKTYTAIEASEILGINYRTLLSRLRKERCK